MTDYYYFEPVFIDELMHVAMSERLKNLIEESILSIAEDKEHPEIIFAVVDTGISPEGQGSFIPFLNLYSFRVLSGQSFDAALLNALKYGIYGFLEDALELVASIDFEISLTYFYPIWPEERSSGDSIIVSTLKELAEQKKERFASIKKFYFHYIGNLDFIKIIDLPA